MSNWVYLFSKFTGEALLFQALAIFLLLGGYAAFWILRKRRIGVVKETIPTGVVKDYLNVLIADAEQLRAQLFGLLASHGVRIDAARPTASAFASVTTAADPALAAKAASLEARMAEQAKAMEALVAEKTKIEKELILAKSAAGASASGTAAAPAAAGGSDPAIPQLQEKISGLEARLAEYSVIEDDLANLKRLQQENAQLKATLAGKGEAVPAVAATAPAAAAVTAAAAAAAAAPAPEAAPAAPAPAPEVPAAAAAPTPPPVAAPVDPTAEAPTDLSVDFEKAVDQIEQGLQPAEPAPAAADAAPAATAPAPAAAAPTPAADSTSTPASASMPKTDEDLVAEFEKMLNG